MGFKVGKKTITMPGEKIDRRMPGSELSADDIAAFGTSLRRMLERGEILTDDVDALAKLDIPAGPQGGSTLVDERVARDALEGAGVAVDRVADRAMVYAMHDVVILKRDVKASAASHKVDADALKRATSRKGAA